ncbi:MAG TPA: DUF3040 domain-containing protein [Actinomycetaceae bacterium]|nr:DUF3040 domain-containing protein [Actinomycetaceae bacterium]
MPLSEYEQRVLAQMEQQLRDADPELAESLQASPRGKIDVRRLSLGILIGLIGVVALVAGVAANQIWLGILGFLAMLSGALLAMTLPKDGSRKSGKSARPGQSKGPSSDTKSSSAFMERQQERWERRQENS